MDKGSISLQNSLKVMRSRVTRLSVYGILIATVALVIATMATDLYMNGSISLVGFQKAQQDNAALWIIDALPFVFGFWGQYVSTILGERVRALVNQHADAYLRRAEELERQVLHDTTHDALTDLPNRILFRDRLQQTLLATWREDRPVALLVLDIDKFKEINDTLGHQAGDKLLKQMATRLRDCINDSDTLARLGGDEFAILSVLSCEDDIEKLKRNVQIVFAKPFVVRNMPLDVGASIGVALAPRHGHEVDLLLQRAEVAMYTAKDERRGWVLYDAAHDKHSSRRLSMFGQLRQAIEDDELALLYQPKVCARTGGTLGVEALVRWQHKEYGLVRPDEFIGLAEQSGLIRDLSLWTLGCAARQTMEWRSRKISLSMAVNLSPSVLLDADLPRTIASILQRAGMPGDKLTIEVTESTLVRDPRLALDVLNRLADTGIRISIDDFGTGYSSLAYLKQMPASELKIDKTFVLDMLENESDAAIVRAIIDLAHDLGLSVVAEGVEDRPTADALRSMGCDVLQGFHFGRPRYAQELDKILEAQHQYVSRLGGTKLAAV